jgi:hypothetical protein
VATVLVSPLPITAAISPSLLCAGNPLSLTANGASNFTWTTPSGSFATAVITDTPNANTSYSLLGANANGCNTSTVITLNINPLPLVNVGISSPSICLGNTVSLNASGNATTYSWSTGATGNASTDTPVASTVYVVTGVSSAGCPKTATVALMVDSFTPGITSSTAICNGTSIQLSATGATTLMWNTGSIFSSITVTPNITTTYSVIGKGANTCIGTNSTTITVNATPTVVAAITKTAICKGESAVMSASGAVNYSWSNSVNGPTVSLSPTITILQTYTVTGINAAGCTGTAQVSLKVNTCAGIEAFSGTSLLSIFPNPAKERIFLEVPENYEGAGLQCLDFMGRLVIETALDSGQQSLDVSTLQRGVYIFRIISKNGLIENQKVLLE